MSGVTINNLPEIKQQIENIKARILAGVEDGMKVHAPKAEQRMEFYIQSRVYDKYQRPESGCNSGNPHYHRTYKLKHSTKSLVENNTLYIYTDTSGMEDAHGRPYAFRVLRGGEYDYPWLCKAATGDFRPARDWVEPTAAEYKENMEQEGIFKKDIVNAVNAKLGR